MREGEGGGGGADLVWSTTWLRGPTLIRHLCSKEAQKDPPSKVTLHTEPRQSHHYKPSHKTLIFPSCEN